MHRLIESALDATAAHWPALQQAYRWVHEAADILANHDQESGCHVQQKYQRLLTDMREHQQDVDALTPAVQHFLKVTQSYAPGLFWCYDIADVPQTDNDLEHFFGIARHQERRATGRKRASPTLFVRGAVRVVASVVTRCTPFTPQQLRPRQLADWQAVDARHAARRSQLRFRRQPENYLAALEEHFVKATLPS